MALMDILGSDAIQKLLFNKLAASAKEKGIKQILVTITPDAKEKFKTDIPTEDSVLISKKLFTQLSEFYKNNFQQLNK